MSCVMLYVHYDLFKIDRHYYLGDEKDITTKIFSWKRKQHYSYWKNIYYKNNELLHLPGKLTLIPRFAMGSRRL